MVQAINQRVSDGSGSNRGIDGCYEQVIIDQGAMDDKELYFRDRQQYQTIKNCYRQLISMKVTRNRRHYSTMLIYRTVQKPLIVFLNN